MPWPYATGPSRGPARLDGWLPPGAWRLEHHAVEVPCDPAAGLQAIRAVRLRDVPMVGGLFRLRGLPFGPDDSLGASQGGCRLWTETWVVAPRWDQRAFFTAYWLPVGPFSAWIRRMLLRAAHARVAR